MIDSGNFVLGSLVSPFLPFVIIACGCLDIRYMRAGASTAGYLLHCMVRSVSSNQPFRSVRSTATQNTHTSIPRYILCATGSPLEVDRSQMSLPAGNGIVI